MDIERVFFNLHRKGLPMDLFRQKAFAYVEAGLLTEKHADKIISTLEQERLSHMISNGMAPGTVGPGDVDATSSGQRLSAGDMEAELRRREGCMQSGIVTDEITDQWRVYSHITDAISTGKFLRLMVQASAGTGKSFLLSTVFLWCLVHGKITKAVAPTGIAASNIEIGGTEVTATTIHALFDLDTEFVTKLDLSKLDHKKVAALMCLEVLLLDEARPNVTSASMLVSAGSLAGGVVVET